jgi:Phage head-tail joining protein
MERGAARLRLTIERRVATSDGAGGELVDYVDVEGAPIWAQEITTGMAEGIETGTTIRTHAVLRLRMVRGLTPRVFEMTDRLRDLDTGRRFELQQVDQWVNGQPAWCELTVIEMSDTVGANA